MKEPRKLPFIPGKPAAEVESELRFHLEHRIQANIAAGMTPDEARQAAVERFGDVEGEESERNGEDGERREVLELIGVVRRLIERFGGRGAPACTPVDLEIRHPRQGAGDEDPDADADQ